MGYLGTLFGPAWGYVMLLGTILSHLGTILNHTPKINDSFTFLIVFNLQQVSFKVFANSGFRCFGALDGPLGPILAPLGPIWFQNASQNGFQNGVKSILKSLKRDPLQVKNHQKRETVANFGRVV